MQIISNKELLNRKIQDYLPDGWPEIIQRDAEEAGIKKGVSIPTIKRIVYSRKVTHKLWPIIWKHVQKHKEMEEQVEEILKPVA